MSDRHPRDLLAAHSLDALDEAEQGALRQHLATCDECAAEVEGYLQVLALLAQRLPPADPSPSLRVRLLAEARRSDSPEPVAQRNGHAEAPARTGAAARRGWLAGWRIPLGPLAAAIAVVALGWGVALQVQLNTLSAQNAQLQVENARLSARDERYVKVVSVLSAAHFQARDLAADTASGASGRVYFDADSGRGMLMVNNLPPPPPGMRYQVWLVRDGERASAALFRTDDSGWGYTLIESDEPMGTYETIGITPEPFDGSAGPTGPRLLGAHF